MFIFLSLGSFVLLFLIIERKSNCWRCCVLSASIIWGVWLTAITEILNLFKLVTFGGLLSAWGLIDIALLVIYFKINKKERIDPVENKHKISLFLFLLLACVGAIVATIGLIAVIAPSNNWDSMTYHMARVAHWIQNHSINHYPTNYLPQLFLHPWAEYAILHFQILSGGDYFANVIQWLAMVGSIIGISLIAKQLGADLRGQVFSSVVCATIPMGILQASSTQNDYVVAFWLVCFVYYLLLCVNKKMDFVDSCRVGSSVSLALLSKGPAYVYVFPFIIWLFFAQIKKSRSQIWKPIVFGSTILLAINGFYYWRNLDLFSSPFGSDPNFPYTNSLFSPTAVISNLAKNIGLQIGTPFRPINGITSGIIRKIHQIIGIDINDPRITWPGDLGNFYVPGGLSTIGINGNEDNAPNTIHFLMVAGAIIICITWKKLKIKPHILPYIIAVIGGLLLFCLLLRWQPWHSRLHLSLFVLSSAIVGVVLAEIPNRKIVNYLAILIILSSIPWLLFNKQRPIIGSNNIFNTSRIDLYFQSRDFLKKPFTEAVDFINSKQCSEVGLSLEKDAWEYPLWVLFQSKDGQEVNLEHINVKNVSATKYNTYPHNKFVPCAIVVLGKKGQQNPIEKITTETGSYMREWSLDPVAVFEKQ